MDLLHLIFEAIIPSFNMCILLSCLMLYNIYVSLFVQSPFVQLILLKISPYYSFFLE